MNLPLTIKSTFILSSPMALLAKHEQEPPSWGVTPSTTIKPPWVEEALLPPLHRSTGVGQPWAQHPRMARDPTGTDTAVPGLGDVIREGWFCWGAVRRKRGDVKHFDYVSVMLFNKLPYIIKGRNILEQLGPKDLQTSVEQTFLDIKAQCSGKDRKILINSTKNVVYRSWPTNQLET